MRRGAIGRISTLVTLALAVSLSLTVGRSEAAPGNLFVKLDHVDVEPYFGPLAKVRLYVNPMTLEGGLIPVKPYELVLEVNGAQRRDRPGVLPYEYTDGAIDLVIVLQVSLRFAPALEDLHEPLGKLVRGLPKPARVSLVTYGSAIRAPTLGEPARAIRALDNVIPEDEDEPPQLIKAVDRAIKILKQAPPPPGVKPRRIILVIGDGSNENVGWDDADNQKRINGLWRAAVADGVTIHAVAFSMGDRRDPYRNVGQLARKTAGTMRWARDRASLSSEIEDLLTEIRKQLVLTFFLPADQIVEAKLRVVCKSGGCGESPLPSNERKGPAPLCAGATCGLGEVCVASQCMYGPITSEGSHLARNFALGALLVVGGAAGTVFARRRKARLADASGPSPRPGQGPGQPPPGQQPPLGQIQIPDFANMPYLAGSAQAKQLRDLVAQMNQGRAPGGAPAAQQPAAAPVLAPGQAGVLLVMNGARQGQSLPLRHGFTIGKTPGCDLLVDDGYTSGYHAQFHLDTAGGCTVVDMNSTNGTFVNGVRTARQALSHGMVVRVGGTEVRYLKG